jgi:hypothetical protein
LVCSPVLLRLSELSSVNRLDRVRICMETGGLLTQPAGA